MAAESPAPPASFARCPACRTLFRVSAEQLAVRDGQVRCGRCKTVFDARARDVAPAIPAPRREPPESLSAEGVHVGGSGSEVVAGTGIEGVSVPVSLAASAPLRSAADEGTEPAREPHASARSDQRAAREQERRSARLKSAGYALAVVLLAVLLAGQALFHFSAAIAAHWPGTAPALTRLCGAAGCSVRPLQDDAMQYLAIDASDLQADAAHRGLLTLTATIRNRAAWALAYPHIELTLTDAQDQVVVRRALSPAEYAGGTVDVAKGIAANGEVPVRLFIDASATIQAGYRLYLFYP